MPGGAQCASGGGSSADPPFVGLQAFVVFESPEEARRACTKDRETFGEKFGDRYVRVYPTLDSDSNDMQDVVLQQSMVAAQVGGCLWRGSTRRCAMRPAGAWAS